MEPQRKLLIACEGVHPITLGATVHFESGRDVEEGDYLKPFKELLAVETASKAGLEDALDLANDPFSAFETEGHRLMLAPSHMQLSRLSAEERDAVGKRRDYWEHSGLWSPYRATVVIVGAVSIGL